MDKSNHFIKDYPFIFFTLLSFLISWVIGVIFLIIFQQILPPYLQPHADLAIKYGPTLAGILTVIFVYRKQGIKRLFACLLITSNNFIWIIVSLLIPFTVVILMLILFTNYMDITGPNWKLSDLSVLGLLFFQKLFLGGGLGEEFGWRGFALPFLQEKLNSLNASLLIGIIWTAWHIPAYLFNQNSEGEMPFLLFTFFVISLSIVLTWIYNSSNGSVLAVIIFHAAINSSFKLVEITVPSNMLMPAMYWYTGLYGIIAILIIFIFGINSLSYKSRVQIFKDNH